MKKYVWLIGATVAAAALIWGISGAVQNSRPLVTVTTLQRQTVEQTVECTGKVEEATGDTKAVAATGSKVQIRVAVPESRLRQVAVGQTAQVTGAAFGKSAYSGTVVLLANTAYTSAAGGTVVDAIIALDAADSTLRCGLNAKAGICVARVENGLLVSYECLREDEDGNEFVYVLEDGCAVRRTVEVSADLAEGALVATGLQEGDRLIQNPDDISGDGARVRTE